MGRKKNKQSKNKPLGDENKEKDKHLENQIIPESIENKLDSKERLCTLKNELNIEGVPKAGLNDEVRFEPYYPSNQHLTSREHFVHSLCQLCKEDPEERLVCPKCQLVTYCSPDHRKQHWPDHAELCAAVVSLCKENRVDHIMQGAHLCSSDKFRFFRFQNMIECENRVERPLEKWEKEIFIYPNLCGKCYQYDQKFLIPCKSCRHSSFCEGHEIETHTKWCEHILRYKNIVKHQSKLGIPCPLIPNCKITSILPKLTNMQHFFKDISSNIDELEFIELTEIVTYPLTTLEALHAIGIGQLMRLNKLTLHVIGAEPDFETNKLEKWEYYLLHLIPGLQNLEIEFIGPELNSTHTPGIYETCSACVKHKKSISFKFHNEVYHKMCDLSKPDLICVFNPGLYRTTGYNGEDTWGATIASMFIKSCPILSTAYTHREALLDVDRVKTIYTVNFKKEPSPNPFSSLKPNLNFVSEEDSPVIFRNQFYCVMYK